MKSTNFSAGWQGPWEKFQEVKHLPATKCNSGSVILCHHVVSHIGPTTVIGEVSKLTGVNCGYCFYIVREESAKDLQALLNLVREWLCYMAGALYGGSTVDRCLHNIWKCDSEYISISYQVCENLCLQRGRCSYKQVVFYFSSSVQKYSYSNWNQKILAFLQLVFGILTLKHKCCHYVRVKTVSLHSYYFSWSSVVLST